MTSLAAGSSPSPRVEGEASPALSSSSLPLASPVRAAPTWSRLEPAGDRPESREDHTLTVDPIGHSAYLFGGRDAEGGVFDDLWRLDLATDTWERLRPAGATPAGRLGHGAAWVPDVGLVVWAGQAERGFLDDLWAYDPLTARWHRLAREGPRPKARYGSCAALGPDGRLWISHGFTEDAGRFDDTWAFDFTASRWSKETPDGRLPGVRCLHDCLWTPDGRLLLYGGQTTGVAALGDLWSREVATGWTRAQRPAPAARNLYALAAIEGAAYLFGGGGGRGEEFDDVWRLDLATLAWTELPGTGDGPAARSGAAMVADPMGSRLILFGGREGSRTFGDLWVLSLPMTGSL